MGKAGTSGKIAKRLDRLEEALEESEGKRKKLKKRLKELEETVEELEALLEDEEDEDDDEDGGPVHVIAPSGHRELSRPDETWTVARLREAATSRGLTGVSRMSKATLIAALATDD